MKIFALIFGLILIAPHSPALLAAPGESVVLDPITGDYTITYLDMAGNLQQAKHIPATKISPSIKFRLKQKEGGVIEYRYNFANGHSAKQDIGHIRIFNISSLYSPKPLPNYFAGNTLEDGLAVVFMWNAMVVSPGRWDGSASPDLNRAGKVGAGWAYPSDDKGKRYPANGIAPGQQQGGFGFQSKDLPGIGPVRHWGKRPLSEGYVDDGPDPDSEIGKQVFELGRHNYVTRETAIPTIAVPEPFDAALLLDRIRTETLSWPAKGLVNPAFVAQLDRYLTAAIESYQRDNPKAGKEHIETLRKMLAKEHYNVDHDEEDEDDLIERKTITGQTIDRLAARVLDFNLRFVKKSAEKDEKHHKEKEKDRRSDK